MKRGIFFDFDSTITTPIKVPRFHRHAVADRPDIFSNMTGEEIVANFGGRQRIARLAGLFRSLSDAGAELFIVSIGLRDSCILPHLRAVGLAKFFPSDNVYGQDSEALRSRDFAKGRLIASLMAERGWEANDALFIDDSARHVEGAASICEVLKVGGRGLSEAELEAIGVICHEGHAGGLGNPVCDLAENTRRTAPTWRLQADEEVPEAAVAVGVWRVAEAPTERVCVDASPPANHRKLVDRSPLNAKQTVMESPPATAGAPMRRAQHDASPGQGMADAATPCRRLPCSSPLSRARRRQAENSPPALHISPTQLRRSSAAEASPCVSPASRGDADDSVGGCGCGATQHLGGFGGVARSASKSHASHHLR